MLKTISIPAPSSPSQQRKLLYANRGLRTGSVDLPDEVEKSLSSASTSPCPSPVRQNQVPPLLLHLLKIHLLFPNWFYRYFFPTQDAFKYSLL